AIPGSTTRSRRTTGVFPIVESMRWLRDVKIRPDSACVFMGEHPQLDNRRKTKRPPKVGGRDQLPWIRNASRLCRRLRSRAPWPARVHRTAPTTRGCERGLAGGEAVRHIESVRTPGNEVNRPDNLRTKRSIQLSHASETPTSRNSCA